MPSHTAPPPPIFHHSPSHVSAAFFIAAFSNGFDGIAGHGVEAPRAASGHRVVGVEESARRPIAAARADDHLALRDARRHRQRVVVLRIRDARFPHDLAGVRVERLQAGRR